MSLCVVLMTDKEILMSSDTRESVSYDNKMFSRHNNTNKIAIVHGKAIFGAGNKSLIEAVWNTFKFQNNSSIEKLREIAIQREKEFVNTVGLEHIQKNYMYPEGKMTLVLTIATMEKCEPVLYCINSYNNFTIEKTLPEINNIKLSVSGARCREAYDYIINYSKPGTDILNFLHETYENLTNEGIGGMLQVYKIDKYGIRLITQNRIIDKTNIQYKSPKYSTDVHYYARSANIQGYISSSAITGSTITGGTVKTAASGARLQLTSEGLMSYNSSNQLHGVVLNAGLSDFSIYSDGVKEFEIDTSILNTLDLRVRGDYTILRTDLTTHETYPRYTWDFQYATVQNMPWSAISSNPFYSWSPSDFVKSMASQNIELQAFDGATTNYIEVWLNGKYLGKVDLI